MATVLLKIPFLVFFPFGSSSIVSQSYITHCQGIGDPVTADKEPCRKKFVVALLLTGELAGTESIHGTVRTVQDEVSRNQGTLKQPFRIELRKTEVVLSYSATYLGSANAEPKEHRIFKSRGSCDDSAGASKTPCGFYKDTNDEVVPDSQGFCCRCPADSNVQLRRSNVSCTRGSGGHYFSFNHYFDENGNRYDFAYSAHCLNFSDLWYDIYRVGQPQFHYRIEVSLWKFFVNKTSLGDKENVKHFWKEVSKFDITPSKEGGRSSDGTVIANIVGDLRGGRTVQDLSSKRLLIPSLRAAEASKNRSHFPEFENGVNDWLLVDNHLVDLSGRKCDKIGVYFYAFRYQSNPCYNIPQSCLNNQPSILWRSDDLRRQEGKKGFYHLHNYGEIHDSSHPDEYTYIIRFKYKEFHNTLIKFNIDASDVFFVKNVAEGRIVSITTSGFGTGKGGTGLVLVNVQNTGEVTATFYVSLRSCFNRKNLPSKETLLRPAQSKVLTFPLRSTSVARVTTTCEAELYDALDVLLGTAEVSFSVEAPCFCYGICGCDCDETTGEVKEKPCPTLPTTVVNKGGVATKLLLFLLNFIGLHGFIGFCGSTLIFFGCMRLCFGGYCMCRKSKAQKHYDDMKKMGRTVKGPKLVDCSGKCRGALAAKARIERKIKRFTKLGKDTSLIDHWANTSFDCTCQYEYTDIRCINIIKALCFFYYILILPFILLGRFVWWRVCVDTVAKKKAAERAVIKSAKKKGPAALEKLGIVSIEHELKAQMKKDKKALKKAGKAGVAEPTTALRLAETPEVKKGKELKSIVKKANLASSPAAKSKHRKKSLQSKTQKKKAKVKRPLASQQVEDVLTREEMAESLIDIPSVGEEETSEDELIEPEELTEPQISDTLEEFDTEGLDEQQTSETMEEVDTGELSQSQAADEAPKLLKKNKGKGENVILENKPKGSKKMSHPLEYSIQEPINKDSRLLSESENDLVQEQTVDSDPLYGQEPSSDIDTASNQGTEHTILDVETTDDLSQLPTQGKEYVIVDIETTSEEVQDLSQSETDTVREAIDNTTNKPEPNH